jgi:hypothetical protein
MRSIGFTTDQSQRATAASRRHGRSKKPRSVSLCATTMGWRSPSCIGKMSLAGEPPASYSHVTKLGGSLLNIAKLPELLGAESKPDANALVHGN